MMPFRPEAATLPSGFRYSRFDNRPTTPEPRDPSLMECQPPSPPRQPFRLKHRRRNVLQYQFDAPSGDCLASTGSDAALPTIEIPEIMEEEAMEDFACRPDSGFLAPQIRESPPKTPIPQILNPIEVYDYRRPDWSMSNASTPDVALSAAMSDVSDCSDDSYFSSIRTSRPSEDGHCTSPEDEYPSSFCFPPKVKEATRGTVPSIRMASSALWTKDMSNHLWQTYQVYLNDPTVTPFRVGASAIPPEGVVVRVAREARRSWKGPQRNRLSKETPTDAMDASLNKFRVGSMSNSGPVTPIDENLPSDYSQWLHSSAATRHHLRELCKRDAVSAHGQRYRQTTQSSQSSHFRAHSTGHATRHAFSTNEFALSLTTSTAESMRPDGPLATLSASQPQKPRPFSYDGHGDDEITGKYQQADIRSRRLGSPFLARTFGPSSSNMLKSFERESQPTPAKAPSLQSPVQFEKSNSLNTTQKRRAQNPFDEELTPLGGGFLRPSILDDHLFGGPFEYSQKNVRRNRGFSLGDQVLQGNLPSSISMPQMPTHSHTLSADSSAPFLLPSATFAGPPSPSVQVTDRNTFPRRLFTSSTIDHNDKVRKRPYTVHHPRRSVESIDFGTGGSSLQSKLRQSERLDERLAAISKRVQEVEKKRANEALDPMIE